MVGINFSVLILNSHKLKTAYRLVLLTILSPVALFAQSEDWFFHSYDTIISGIEMHDRESYDSALTMYEKIHPGDTNYDMALYERALTLYAAERYEEAIAICREGLKTNSRFSSQFIVNLGNALDDMDRTEEAQAVYDSGIAMFPGSHSLYYNRAIMHLAKGRDKEGVADLMKAIEMNPYHASSHFQLANLCARNGNYTQALMAAGYYFIIEPASGRSHAILSLFNSAVSEKNDFEAVDYDFDPDGTYSRSDRLIASYAALRDNYEVDSDVDYPLVKQMHLAFTQAQKAKNKKGFFELYYLPYYQALMEDEERFEMFSYLMSASIESDYYQRIVSKNIDDIKELISWNSDFLTTHHERHILGYEAGAPEVYYIFHEGTDGLSGRQLLDESGKPTQDYEFYFTGGAVSAHGKLNENNRYDGEVTFYHRNGKVRKEATYVDGDLEGESREYNDRGAPSLFATYKLNTLDGPATVFYSHGAKSRVFNFTDGVPTDTMYMYFANGQLQARIPQQEGKDNGLATFYHENGSLLSKINFKNDERSGPAEFYYPNGQLKVKTTYNDEGLYDGHYQYYHSNGELYEEGDYIEGVQIGNWKTFDATGNLIREVNFDEGGKKTGTEAYFDNKGRKTELFRYKKEELEYYEGYDLEGNVQISAEEKRGKINYREMSLYGTLIQEGTIDADKRVGRWISYNDYGVKSSEREYNEEGENIGEIVEYFAVNGKRSAWSTYNLDTLHGPFGEYYLNGQLQNEGIYYDGDRQGLYREYYMDGTLASERYYVNGKINGPRKYYAVDGELSRIEYFDMGTIIRIENYYQGKMTSGKDYSNPLETLIAYYPNGKKYFEINRTGTHYQGKAQWFYGNGGMEVDGQFTDGLQDGTWKYYYPNGQMSREAHYDLGTNIGELVTYYRDGTVSGKFSYLEGEIHGPNVDYSEEGIMTDSLNYWYGNIDSDRYFYTETGELQHIRVYDLGKIIGWRKLNADGSAGEFVEIKEGTAKIKANFPNGKTAIEYELKAGEIVGSYTSYYPNGQIEMKLNYKDGEYNGEQLYYYPDGTVMRRVNYNNGMLEGTETYYHPNGKVYRELNWMLDKKHGKEKQYDENGNLLAEYTFYSNDLYE